MKKKKVLFFLPPSVGGAERVTITIAKMLDRVSFDVHFVIVGRDRGVIAGLIPEGYPIHLVKVRNIWCFATSKICRLLHQERPDGVFCSMRYLNLRLIIAARLCKGIKIIVRSNHNVAVFSPFNQLLMGRLYPLANCIIAQQEEMKQDMVGMLNIDASLITVLNNPVDVDAIRAQLEDAKSPYASGEDTNYVWTARIERHKGQDVLINAFVNVVKVNPKAHLYLVGAFNVEDSFYQLLIKLVNDLGIRDKVHFQGYSEKPYVWMKYADVFVMPSRTEGLPNALLEAMYIGTPVVATTCIPAIERLVDDGKNGILVPSEDYLAMAEALLKAPKMTVHTSCYTSAKREEVNKLFKKAI